MNTCLMKCLASKAFLKNVLLFIGLSLSKVFFKRHNFSSVTVLCVSVFLRPMNSDI